MDEYRKALQILANPEFDFRSLVYEIAKDNPQLFVTTYEKIKFGTTWQETCKILRDGQGLVPAIKHCREITGMSLADAKKTVEELV